MLSQKPAKGEGCVKRHDAVGNITDFDGEIFAYIDVQPHAVTAAFSNTYGYDDNGNQVTRVISGTTYTMEYDFAANCSSRVRLLLIGLTRHLPAQIFPKPFQKVVSNYLALTAEAAQQRITERASANRSVGTRILA